jgi:hypothetical protein
VPLALLRSCSNDGNASLWSNKKDRDFWAQAVSCSASKNNEVRRKVKPMSMEKEVNSEEHAQSSR